jgi:hypothetical protein
MQNLYKLDFGEHILYILLYILYLTTQRWLNKASAYLTN